MKTDAYAPNKLHINFKDVVLDAFNHNIGTLLINNAKTVLLEVIILTKTKAVSLALIRLHFGMESIV